VVPNKGTQRSIGKRIVVAWNGRREAARALFDALPLLQRADKVSVVRVGVCDETAMAAVCAALGHHGVHCDAQVVQSQNGEAASAILDHCKAVNADLLVMGCYGHSRLREFVLGGATRYVLRNMSVPVLMSH
jgi:nucleotide-binding universal stress UspA family protein